MLASINNVLNINTILEFLLIINIDEPYSYNQAMKTIYKKEWFLTYKDKIKDFKAKNYYNIIDILENNKVIISRQVFKKKLIINNYILSYYIIDKNKEFRFKAYWVI